MSVAGKFNVAVMNLVGRVFMPVAGECPFRAAQAEAKRVADQEAAAAKVQFTVLSTTELNRLKGTPGSSQD